MVHGPRRAEVRGHSESEVLLAVRIVDNSATLYAMLESRFDEEYVHVVPYTVVLDPTQDPIFAPRSRKRRSPTATVRLRQSNAGCPPEKMHSRL